MRGTPLTPAVVLRELGRLLDIYARPKQYPSDNDALARVFTEACGDVSSEQFTQAVTEYLRGTGRFFPRPGEIRALALAQPGADARGTATGWDQWLANGYRADPNGPLTACPACGQEWEWCPRLTIVHRHLVHRALGLPCIGHCDEPVCAGPPRSRVALVSTEPPVPF